MINWFKRPQRTSRGSAPLLFLSFHWWSHSRHLGSLQSSLFDLILPSVKFRFPLSSSSSFPQFFLLPSRSSLCSRCLLRPSGSLFRLIGSIHQRSLESRGFSRIQTHVQPSPSYSPGPQCQFSPLELDRLTSNNFISLLSLWVTVSGDVDELLTAWSTKMSQPVSLDQSSTAVAHFCLGETLQLHPLEFVRVSQIKALISVPPCRT